MVRLLDYASRPLDAQTVRAAGYDGVVRYLVNSPDRGLPNKRITPAEAASFTAAKMPIVSNWQRGKHDTADWRRGFGGGAEDATNALAWHRKCGGPEKRPIYFSVDEDVSLDTWNTLVLPYLNGAASVLGKDSVGVYGGQRSMWWAADDGFRWRWQTKAWSRYDANGNWNSGLPVQWVEGVNLRQERVDQDTVGGIGVDVNTTWSDDYGQWNHGANQGEIEMERGDWTGDPTWLADLLRLWGVPVWEDPDWKVRGHGDFRDIRGVIGHHTAGGGVNDWLIVRNGRPDLAGPLAQIVLEKDGTARLICVGIANHAGPGDGSAWAPKFTKREANFHTIGIEAVSKGTPPWDWTPVQLENYKRIVAAILWRINKDSSWFCGHREYNLVDGKIDPAGINLDQFRTEVQTKIDAGPAGAPKTDAIAKLREDGKHEWLGSRTHDEPQRRCPDGIGLFAHYQNGSIYWHPKVGAHAVSGEIMEFWSSVGWETSWLKYPVDEAQNVNGGVRQVFQGGDIYAKVGEQAWPAHGGIRSTWAATGAEEGPYGWPRSREQVDKDDLAVIYQRFEKDNIYWRMSDGAIAPLKYLEV